MNGVVNGTMEEPMDTSLLNSPTYHNSVTSAECDAVENHCESSNNIQKNHIDSETSNGLAGDSNPEDSTHDLSSDSGAHPVDEHVATSAPLNDDQSNSKESTSAPAKPEIAEPQDIQTVDEKSKDGHPGINYPTGNSASNTDEIDSEDDSSLEEGSVISGDPKADTVSINSDLDSDEDETSQESQVKKDTEIIILDNDRSLSRNGNSHGSASPVVHEIPSDNDDDMSESDDKYNTEKSNLRGSRGGRSIKMKKYDLLNNGDYESDIEEVEMEDPLGSKPIIINDTKDLVQMAAKQIKVNQTEPTVVIIDTKSGKKSATKNSVSLTSLNAQALYQDIIARGTTVTPVSSSKGNSATQISSANTQPLILPSLTDDMFVVEAPSFIVPYVYEKPSLKPFREFVDILGKDLEEQRAKEVAERLEIEQALKVKRDMDRRERKERGEKVSESEDEVEKAVKTEEGEDDDKKKKKIEKRERRKRRNDDDDASWDGESSTDSEDETLTDDDTVVIKDKADSFEGIKDVTDLTGDKVCSGKSDNYFDCSLGKFFINVGLNMVQEYVQNDLLKQQKRKLSREKKSGRNTKPTETSIASLMKNLEFSKENNAPYTFPQIKCEFCSFKSNSTLVMNNHLEIPHMKNNVYKCNFCPFEIKSPHDILHHMEVEHKVRGKLERAPACHQCCNCPFEDNGKGKLARHQISCAKKFKPDMNLSPPVEWEPPAKIPKITKPRNTMVNSYQSAFSRQVANNMSRTPITMANLMPPASGGFRARGRSPLGAPTRSAHAHGAPVVRGGVMLRHNAPTVASNYPVASNGNPKSHQPSLSITPLPRHPPPQVTQQPKSTFVICEICDGYIKDLEQLRNHMQWIHKVKIHPKMIYNRPPLNCQKCQFRFFTDQGLERHLLGSHGLVTSSMQEAANKGKDAGRCPVCGRVYQWKLLGHVAKDHNMTLKPAHLSYKCTVCTATFGMYKQFENHVYSAHSVVAKRVMDKGRTSAAPAKPVNDSMAKPLKINDEITITPQSVKPTTSSK